jgi:hypothetical protein
MLVYAFVKPIVCMRLNNNIIIIIIVTRTGFCICFCHVIASFIMLKIMQWIFGLRILVELIKCVG